MSFDGIVTRAVTLDMKEKIETGKVTKIHQPHSTDVVFTIRAHGKNHTLFFSVNPSFARFHLTNIKFQNPSEPPMFCMVLRKHLEGSILEKVEQQDLERQIIFSFRGRDELGDVSYKKLIFELMGRHSNIIFIDSEKEIILDSIKHIPPSLSSYRTVMPGFKFENPPHMEKLNPLVTDEDTLIRKIDLNKGKINQQLLSIFSGLSPQIISEITYKAGFITYESLPKAFNELLEPVKAHHYSPQIIYGKKENFSVLPLEHLEGEVKTFNNVNDMLDFFYIDKSERDRVKQQAFDLERFLRNEYAKNKKKIKKLEKSLLESEKAQQYQKYGELITAHMHTITYGDSEVVVTDYYDPEQGSLSIPLEKYFSPADNAQAYFKKYHKLKNSVNYVYKEIKKAKAEMYYLDQLLEQMAIASTTDIAEIREELESEGYLKKKKTKKKKKPTKPVPEKYQSTEGIEIFVGKNNKQNEFLTMKFAHQDDTWLHVKDIPGSHVVIRSQDYSEQTLTEAAQLAAFFSKARESSNVPVDFTKIRHVKKPNGAKPGFVTYDKQSTMYVTPNKELTQQMKVR